MKKILIASALAVMSMSAFATDMYVAGSLGQSKLHNVDSSYFGGAATLDTKDDTLGFAVGINVMPNVAVEVGYTKLGTFDGQVLGTPLELKGSAYHASVIGSFEVMPQTNVFGRLGLARTTGKVEGESEKTTSVLYGLGAEYHMTPEWSATLEYQYIPKAGKVDDTKIGVSSINLGLKYGF